VNIKRRFHFLSAFLAPFIFSTRSGHFLSAIKSRAVDRRGEALPWYSYPAIDYLSELDFSEAEVLEFGGGQSTAWWCERAKSVTCLEADKHWSAELSKRLGERATIHHVGSPTEAAKTIGDHQFDVIVVDDGSGVGPEGRVDNAKTAFKQVKPYGLVIADNSDAPYSHPIAKIAYEAGWCRIDFLGFAPGSLKPYCTSLFFKELSPTLRIPSPPHVRK